MITSMLVPVRSERLISVRLISWAWAKPVTVVTASTATPASENLTNVFMGFPPLKEPIVAAGSLKSSRET